MGSRFGKKNQASKAGWAERALSSKVACHASVGVPALAGLLHSSKAAQLQRPNPRSPLLPSGRVYVCRHWTRQQGWAESGNQRLKHRSDQVPLVRQQNRCCMALVDMYALIGCTEILLHGMACLHYSSTAIKEGQHSLTYHPSASGPETPGMRPAVRPWMAHAGGWQAAAARAAAAPSRARRSRAALLLGTAGCALSLLRRAAAGAAARGFSRWG